MSQLKNYFSYKKFSNPPYRILFLNKHYYLQNETISVLNEMGNKVYCLEVPENPKDMLDQLLKTSVQFKPDCVFGMNHIGFDSGGEIASILSEFKIPVIFWYLDDYRFIIGDKGGHALPNIILFTFEKNNIESLKKTGFENVFYMPSASALKPETNYSNSKYSYLRNAVSFIGSTFEKTKEQWYQSGYDELVKEIDFNDYFQNKNETLIEYIEKHQSQYFSSKADLYHYAGVAAAEATQIVRKNYISGIRSGDIHIFGDEKWNQFGLTSNIHKSVHNIEVAPLIYSTSGINLNISSCQLETAVNLRLFDIPAANGFLLTDWKDSLADLFDCKNEIVTYYSINEMNDKIDYYLRNIRDREIIVLKAKKRIQSEHLLKHRIKKILAQTKICINNS